MGRPVGVRVSRRAPQLHYVMALFTPEYFIDLAIDLARQAENLDEVPVGAVLVHENKVIAQGFNLRESSGRTVAHAEIMAIEDYNKTSGQWRLPKETSLYVTVEPCLMCTGALLSARVDRIFYGAKDPKGAGLSRFDSIISAGLFDHRFLEVYSDIAGERCAQLMSNYFKRKRAKPFED